MANNADVKLDYADSDGLGNVTLMALPFGKNGKEVYAKVDRSTVNTENLIARADKKGCGVRPHILKLAATIFKEELVEALNRGESVNFLGVGTFYPVPVGAEGSTPETLSVNGFKVKCSASKDVNDAVSSLKLNKVSKFDNNPVIEKMTDVTTGKTDGSFKEKTVMRIDGNRLKIGGEEGGVFFAPFEEDGIADETMWVKVETFVINEPMTLAFVLPDSLKALSKYAVILKTNLAKNGVNNKTYKSTIGSAIRIQAQA